MFLHTFYTWLLANLLHPLFLFFISVIIDGSFPQYDYAEVVTIFAQIWIISLLYSLPCLFTAWGCLYIISYIPVSMIQRFLIWLFSAFFLVVMELLIVIGFNSYISASRLLYGLPAVWAVFGAIIIRFPQFRKLIHPTQTNDHEPAEV